MISNGHTNGFYQNGEELAESIMSEPNLIRENVNAMMATLDEHGAKGIRVDQKLVDAVPIVAAQLMQNESARMKAAGARLVQTALKYNLDRFNAALHEARLLSGEATERVENYNVAMPEARSRITE